MAVTLEQLASMMQTMQEQMTGMQTTMQEQFAAVRTDIQRLDQRLDRVEQRLGGVEQDLKEASAATKAKHRLIREALDMIDDDEDERIHKRFHKLETDYRYLQDRWMEHHRRIWELEQKLR